MKSAVSNVFFSPCHIFANIEKQICPWSIKLIRGIESNCEMILELHVWLETALKCSFSMPPNNCQLPMGTSRFALPAQLYFFIDLLKSSHSPPWGSPGACFPKRLLVQPALTFPINLYRLGLSEIEQTPDTQPAPALAGDTGVAPSSSLSGPGPSPPSTCLPEVLASKMAQKCLIQKGKWYNSGFRPKIHHSKVQDTCALCKWLE